MALCQPAVRVLPERRLGWTQEASPGGGAEQEAAGLSGGSPEPVGLRLSVGEGRQAGSSALVQPVFFSFLNVCFMPLSGE